MEQFKAILAAEIIKALDRDGLSMRAAHRLTGIAAADFSRIRNADLRRFTVNRLMTVINRLGSRVEVKLRVRHADPPRDDGLRRARVRRELLSLAGSVSAPEAEELRESTHRMRESWRRA